MSWFNWFKKTEQVPDGISQEGVHDMKASIGFDSNVGKFTLNAGGTTVGTYARSRDARRGAARRGLTLIEA